MLNHPAGRHVVLGSTDAPVATVIVLAWRLVDQLLDALEALSRSSSANPFNITVVLNGADDAVRRAVFGHVTGANVVEVARNIGFAGGCNLGAVDARGPFVAFMNDDARPDPEWLDNLIECARARPDAGAISSRVYNQDGTLQEAGARILAGPAGTAMGLGAETVPADLGQRRNVDYGGGEALLVRRELFVELGGFDQGFDPAYFEDVDLCLRLRAAGWAVVYEPSAVVVHHRSMSTREDVLWREFAAGRSAALFTKYWGPLLPNAATLDDPPSVLMPVPHGFGSRRLDLFAQVAASRDVDALDQTRQREYRDWLEDRLRRVSATVEDEESPREELETEIEELRSALQTLEGRLGPLEELHTGVSVRQQAPTRSGTAPTHMLLGRRARAWLRSQPHIRRVVSVLRAPRR